jgi:hypothetical protein
MADEGQGTNGNGGGVQSSTVVRAAAAAAATGAAAYALNRVRSHHDDEPDEDERDEQSGEDENDGGGVLAKKDDLAQTLSSKASDVKDRAKKLRPGKRNDTLSSVAGTAWESASQHLVPVAGQAAAAAGEALARKAPEFVRDELMPRFIEGFQKGS